jgi:hypothetical protein
MLAHKELRAHSSAESTRQRNEEVDRKKVPLEAYAESHIPTPATEI